MSRDAGDPSEEVTHSTHWPMTRWPIACSVAETIAAKKRSQQLPCWLAFAVSSRCNYCLHVYQNIINTFDLRVLNYLKLAWQQFHFLNIRCKQWSSVKRYLKCATKWQHVNKDWELKLFFQKHVTTKTSDDIDWSSLKAYNVEL